MNSHSSQQPLFGDMDRSTFDHRNPSEYARHATRGLSKELVKKISRDKNEPSWMQEFRLEGLRVFTETPFPTWGPNLEALNFDDIIYYAAPSEIVGSQHRSWEEVPQDIKNTFDKLGIPEAEKRVLAGVGAQYESEMVYHRLKREWEEHGVIFEDMDVALQKYPDLVREYFMKCVPVNDHKFAALHAAVWSGGTFLYVPRGVKVAQPVQAYFRMNAKNMGQFEHTIIIIEDGAEAHYIEGCSAPKYGAYSLHAGCVEIVVKRGARMRYSSVENWSSDTYNLNTKRAMVMEDARMEWVGGNMGSGVTMLYPCSMLVGKRAHAEHLGIAFAGKGQIQDTGAKIFHSAPQTTSNIVMKSVSKDGGRSIYRGLVHVAPYAEEVTSHITCDALLLDDHSRSDTIPRMKIQNNTASVTHEASAGRVSQEDIFYLQTRGLSQDEATSLVVNGFIEPVVKQLPVEYAVEMNRLIELEMEGAV